MRVNENSIETKTSYQYFSGTPSNPTWSGSESSASTIVNSPAGELSVSWNEYLSQYVMLYLRDTGVGQIEIRTASNLWGPWSQPKKVVDSNSYSCLYAPYTKDSYNKGSSIYFRMSRFCLPQWNPYSTYMMKVELEKNCPIPPACQGRITIPNPNGCPTYECPSCGDGVCAPNENPENCNDCACPIISCPPKTGCYYAGGNGQYGCPICGDLICPSTCGNNICEANENCPQDCGSCGNGICEPSETCPRDCIVCGNGICEDSENCTTDCNVCGNNICEPQENCPQDCQTYCSDGTITNSCSTKLPFYCSSGGYLAQNCKTCGCYQGEECYGNGQCFKIVNETAENNVNVTICADGTRINSCLAQSPL